jgi:hypothetical protein
MLSGCLIKLAMDNCRRGLHSHAGASVKTGLTVCITEIKNQN